MGKKIFKAVKSVVKTVSKPFQSIGKAVVKGVSSVFKTPDMPDVKQPDPAAPPAPEAEQTATDVQTPENISRSKRQRRNGLRIDLNSGGGGTGLNVPVG